MAAACNAVLIISAGRLRRTTPNTVAVSARRTAFVIEIPPGRANGAASYFRNGTV
jgi:hypothetical protein